MNPSTLTEVLQDASALNDRGITFIEQGDREDFLSYQELYGLSLKGLYVLQHRGLKPKDELVFQVEDNRTFIIIFWSCMLGGIIPVPLSIGKNDDQKAKLFNVWAVLDNPYLVSTSVHLEKIAGYGLATGQEHLFARIKGKAIDLKEFATVKDTGEIHQAKPTDLAFIQFSSGSTGSPKGVMLTHENLISNVAAIGSAAAYATTDATLSWMPLTHDMGLIGFHINPLFSQMNQYLMPTSLFVRNPTLWLTKATTHRTTVICSPNFGYKYLLKYYDESKSYDWDLSSVRIIYNGAEPISEELGFNFLEVLEKFGLRKTAMCPVYGLAEASLAVSISKLEAEMHSISLNRNELLVGNPIQPASVGNALSFVNVGTAINDVLLNITDDEGLSLADAVIGHVCIKGKNVTAGYYNNPIATNKAISADGWLDTGDLGFMKDGALYITGRAKDVFFINGQNFYPHDLERVAEAVEGVELNKIIISGATGSDSAIEEVIAFVFHRGDISSFTPILQALKAHINLRVGVELAHVIPVKDIPKTTSGKLQRFKLVEKYEAGAYTHILKELAEIERTDAGAASDPAESQNETEQKLLNIWQQLFNKPRLSVTDKFFEIGGNSLKAAEFAMMVLKRFEVELPLTAMYNRQSIREIAADLDSFTKTEYQSIPKAQQSDRHQVSSLQRRLFYFQETHPASTAYNVPVAFETSSAIDVERLEKNLNSIIRQYDILNTSFFQEGNEVFMRSHQKTHHTINVLEVDELKPELLPSLIKPFDLKKPGLFNISLIQSAKDKTLLYFDFHHIVMDGVSLSYFIHELIQRYLGEKEETLSVQYIDFVQWSETYWQTEAALARKEYWLNALSGELPLLEMPLDRPRPNQFDHQGDKLNFSIGKAKSEKLRAMSKKYNCSMHVLMFAVYHVLLHKYTGQREMVIGIPVTARNHPDVSRTMGMFVNNLAIRASIAPDASFEDLLESLARQINEAMSNDYPFDLLLDELDVKRGISRNPVFDTMFLYQNMDLPAPVSETLRLKRVPISPNSAKFDISQEVFDDGSGPLSYGFEYASSLFDRETIQRLAVHFDTLLERILINPETKIADISPLSVEEYQAQVFGFNDNHKPFAGQTALDLIESQINSRPNATAIVSGDKEVSYATLAAQSNAVAQALQAEGLEKGDVVALYMPRSPELIVGVIGIMKAGGVYLPIDTDLPEKRVQYLLSHSKCSWALTSDDHYELIHELSDSGVQVINIEALLSGGESAAVAPTFGALDQAYLLYTSGTTGKPKGVMVSHKALHNYVAWAAATYVGQDKGNFPLFTSISFDLTLTSLFTPLATGHSIVIYNDNAQEKEHPVIRAVLDNQVDIIKLTPSHLRLLREVDLPESGKRRLQKMIVGGESFETSLARNIHEKFSEKVLLFNEYGPTEATVGCMIHEYSPDDFSRTVPIGIPAANTQIYLLDEQLHPVPEGITGEIYIAGSGLASGYRFDETLTSEKFILNPFLENECMYKTGDLAKRLFDGTLEYLGRTDEQVKINGYRIEPDEINHCLRQYPGITDAVVVVRDLKGRKSLFAYLLTDHQKEDIHQTDLKTYLSGHLPFYMIPAGMVVLEAFPVTANGKIDYRALQDLPMENEQVTARLPEGDVEKLITRVWQDLLGTDSVAMNDNFFELGGDSIKAVQIVARLHEKGISVQVKDILTYHTIEQLIQSGTLSQNSQQADQGIISGPKENVPIESWFFSQQFANPSFYNQSLLLNINEAVDINLLQRAFEKLVNHHDGLRLNYDKNDQVLFFNKEHLNQAFSIPVIEQEEDFKAQLVEAKSGFDISQSLLIKTVVFSNQGEQKHLFITAHHLVTDGLSWRIMLYDLLKVYQALATDSKLVLPPKTESLAEWQQQLKDWQAQYSSDSNQYWEETKQVAFKLPLDFETKDWSVAGMRQHSLSLDEAQTEFLLKEAHKAYRTDVFTLLNVALVWTLNQWTGDTAFVIEHENHGRHLDECDVSRTLGWFTAMYPVKLELVGQDPSVQIKSIKEQIKSIPDHGLSYDLSQNSGESKAAMSEIRLNYLGEFDLDNDDYWSFSGLPTGPETASDNHLTTKLDLNAMVMNKALSMDIAYHQSAFSDSTIQDFSDRFLSNMSRLLDQIRAESDVHFTPSDFEAELDQQELDELFL